MDRYKNHTLWIVIRGLELVDGRPRADVEVSASTDGVESFFSSRDGQRDADPPKSKLSIKNVPIGGGNLIG